MIDCNVCIIGDYEGENIFSSDTRPKARRPHVCGERGGAISPGQTYVRSAGKSGGSIWAVKTCEPCDEIRHTFYCEGAWTFGKLWEDMEEQAFPELTTASACFTELSPLAKTLVMDKWRASRGLVFEK